LQKKFEILEQNHNKEAIRNSIQSRFSKEIILDKYFEVFKEYDFKQIENVKNVLQSFLIYFIHCNHCENVAILRGNFIQIS
jgi:hypothetical protein